MHNISIFGTQSDAGKSTITFVIGKIIQNLGYRVVPFKAQNVSNNAHVADDGSEIAIAQYFQAEVLNVTTSYHLNPVLLKSGKGSNASLIIEGKSTGDKDVWHYYRDINQLKPIVSRCFNYLDARYDCVICEGAGSPVELNLMDKDLSNIYIAQQHQTKIILVADIEKGGVFASVYGVYQLLPKSLQANVVGVIINKFRGDMALFDQGVDIIEQQFGIPVLGVLPYQPFNLGFEDSASLQNFAQQTKNKKCDVAVIAYPTMSNYNDFEVLIADPEINLEFINANVNLSRYHLIILPGSKKVMADLNWLKTTGLFKQLQQLSNTIYGLCGGYEMLFNHIIDPLGIEAEQQKQTALGFIDDDITFASNKILKKQRYTIFNTTLNGFEMHHGVSQKYPLYYQHNNILGSFVHGVFDDNHFRQQLFSQLNPSYQGFDFQQYKTDTINNFVNTMTTHIDVDRLIKSVC